MPEAHLNPLDPAERALAQEQVEHAVALLERAARQPDRAVKAKSNLQLAALYALQGEAGIESGTLHLIRAADADGYVCATPLYQALCWEFAAYCNDHPKHIRRGLRTVLASDDMPALFHAARALVAAGMNRRAIRLLSGLEDARLPQHLVWRRWSLIGQAYANCADFARAVEAYATSSSLVQGREGVKERLSLAEGHLVLGHLDKAFSLLDELCSVTLDDDLNLRQRYLWALLQTRMGNARAALDTLLEAYTMAEAKGYTVFEILLELGRIYMQLGNEKQANASYEKASQVASDTQLSFITHEHAVMLSETGRFEEAERLLKRVTSDTSYKHRALAFSDLAHIALQQGLNDQAATIARYALSLDSNPSAYITLAETALQGFDFPAALGWLEQALSLCDEKDPNWLSVHVLFAEVLAQEGYVDPGRLIHHAETALQMLDDDNEWTPSLTDYLNSARRLLISSKRLLN